MVVRSWLIETSVQPQSPAIAAPKTSRCTRIQSLVDNISQQGGKRAALRSATSQDKLSFAGYPTIGSACYVLFFVVSDGLSRLNGAYQKITTTMQKGGKKLWKETQSKYVEYLGCAAMNGEGVKFA